MPYLFLKYPGYKKDFVYGRVNVQSDEGILKDWQTKEVVGRKH